jgi:uncharacterized glyoxalase superfamily protein PhnB
VARLAGRVAGGSTGPLGLLPWVAGTAHGDGVTHLIRVRVEDVSAQFERARAHGARVLEPPTDREYGERDCTVEDVAGHRWQFAETVRDVAPEDYGCTTVAPWPGRPGA